MKLAIEPGVSPFHEFNSQGGGWGKIYIGKESINLFFRWRKNIWFQIDVYGIDTFYYESKDSFWVRLTKALSVRASRIKCYNLLWEFLKENEKKTR
jgi:hypothetical protein